MQVSGTIQAIVQSPSKCSLLDRLPVEMILTLAETLPVQDTHSLIQVSSNLNAIVTPVFLKKMGLELETEASRCVVSGSGPSALRTWLEWVDFAPPASLLAILSWDTTLSIAQCEHLATFFRSLPFPRAIKTVTVFAADTAHNHLRPALDSIIESGARYVNVDHSDSTSVVGTPRYSPRIHRSAHHYPYLRDIELPSHFFGHDCLSWTLGVINGAFLDRLTLSMPEQTAPPLWSDLLGLVELPSLRTLRVEGHLSAESLEQFLARHTALEDLEIGARSIREDNLKHIPCRSQSLFRLHHLAAPLSYIRHLVGTPREGMPARLRRLEVFPDVSLAADDFLDTLTALLGTLDDMESLMRLIISAPRLVGQSLHRLALPQDGLAHSRSLTSLDITQEFEDPFEFGEAFIVRPQ